ncbi:MAG: diaminopimelate decarboxylase [Pseudomonadota bacterium]|nr:diaminopimelate decarboxylase [Pseudomonadota bacterium]
MTNGFAYQGANLHAEDVAIGDVAKEVGTPFYCYSAKIFRYRYIEFADAFSQMDIQICYAVKANSNQAVIALFGGLGAGADVVSEGEMRRALAAGIEPEKIVFSGVGKTRAELSAAVAAKCGQFNVESEPELEVLAEVAAQNRKTATVALRVNPDVDAETHHKISTGRSGDKFGIQFDRILDVYHHAASLPGIKPTGLAIHIGSQLTGLAPFRAAFEKIADLVRKLRASGHTVDRLDLGGGLGITYQNEKPPSPMKYAQLVMEVLGKLRVAFTLEPGRRLTGDAGILVTKVIYLKESGGRRFAVVDAAMNDLIRPTLYEAWHDIDPVVLSAERSAKVPIDIVGPICETGDVFAAQRALPPLIPGDLLAVRSAGAYGAVMSSTYNSRLLIPEVMVNGDQFAVIRPRATYDRLIEQDIVPDW